GSLVPEQETPQPFIDNPQRNNNTSTSPRGTTGTVNNTLHSMPVTTLDCSRQQGDPVLTPDICQTALNGPTKPAQFPCEHDAVVQLQLLVERLRATIRNRDRRIQDLEREVDKLRSVLDQQITDSWGAKESSASALQTISLNPEISSPLAPVPSVSDPDEAAVSSPPTVPVVVDVLETSPTTPPIAAALLLHKRLGVSGESMRTAKELKYFEKDAKSRQQIREALRSNDLLMNLDAVQLQEMVSCMHEQTIPVGCFIIREGDYGEHLYVGAEGEYEVIKGGKRLCVMTAGRCFGELALLYNCKRTASVKALTDSRVWVLERACFQAIMMKTGLERIEERKTFLSSVPLLKDLPSHRILRIADALEAQYHAPGDCIIRQGELADSFFIIQSGQVRVTICTVVNKETGEAVEHNIRHMSRGEYFGEKALLCECRRTANVYALGPSGVEVLCLYRKDFLELIGDLQELKNKPYMDEADLGGPRKLPSTPPCPKTSPFDPRFAGVTLPDAAIDVASDTTNSIDSTGALGVSQTSRLTLAGQECALQPKPLQTSIRLTDLERVCVLGVGGFGRVDLVTLTYDRTQAFALKRMQKQHIVQTRQQEHVHFEKLILSSVNSPFICRLYATFRDSKHVYMLLEACLGGELWTILRDSHNLDDRTTRFCLACCIESLDYLHRHGIIYRDLKPENMLITARGYIKMCDFGFAKFIGIGQKTWTFCGTPEYVAPEVILNKGHDFAADYWSLGILTFELLTGTPPFQASEPIKIYMKTLKGIDALGLAQNKYICLKALQFIRRLCRFNPSERLGVGKHGIQEIRSHKYFQGFDWAAIAKQSSPTPFKVKLNGPLDYSNFDRFTMDEQEPPDESSGWDDDF
ncbi:cGMP dependent protein kinase, partial [Paragonimus heterotremus]